MFEKEDGWAQYWDKVLKKDDSMNDYTFRGKPISGHGASALLKAIHRVQDLCPHPTSDDVIILQKIIADFSQKYEEDLLRDQEENFSSMPETD